MTNEEILNVKSPTKYVGGPYAVVLKNDVDMWAIVALEWEGERTLGIRWFNTKYGMPVTHRANKTYSLWFRLPQDILGAILSTVEDSIKESVEDFLSGKITGEDLKQKLEL